jgi:hypothetical protein
VIRWCCRTDQRPSAGTVDAINESRHGGVLDVVRFSVTCQDYAAIFDHRIVSARYAAVTTGPRLDADPTRCVLCPLSALAHDAVACCRMEAGTHQKLSRAPIARLASGRLLRSARRQVTRFVQLVLKTSIPSMIVNSVTIAVPNWSRLRPRSVHSALRRSCLRRRNAGTVESSSRRPRGHRSAAFSFKWRAAYCVPLACLSARRMRAISLRRSPSIPITAASTSSFGRIRYNAANPAGARFAISQRRRDRSKS